MKNVAAITLLVMATSAGTALSATTPVAIPATNDYVMETRPMIVGTVASVSDYQMVVDSEDGTQVTLSLDTRTMRPVDLAPGMVMRTEFRVLDNGDQYAQRIVPLRGAELEEWKERTAYLHTDSETETIVTTDHTSDAEPTYVTAQSTGTTDDDATRSDVTTDRQADASVTNDGMDDDREVLPQTASAQPLLALLGLLAVGSAGAFWIRRRRA